MSDLQREETLAERLTRLDEERRDADRRYNEALTGLDRALPRPGDFPHPPPQYDASKLPQLNGGWRLLPERRPSASGTVTGRLRAFVQSVVDPLFASQQHFNAVLVDHLNRNVAIHEESQRAAASTIACLREQVEALAHFNARLIQYLQTITIYVDTRDRASETNYHVLNAGITAITDDWLRRWEAFGAREARMTHKLSAIDDLRDVATLAQQTALSLKREVERLIAQPSGAAPAAGTGAAAPAPAANVDLDAFKYLGFENAFRGSPAAIRARLASYLPRFDGLSDVLDIGCGRGEFLDLLREHGISARGLDLNQAMVDESRARGLDVVLADALTYLRELPDGSLGGLFASQVIEHLPPGYLTALIETAGQKIRPGGAIVLETINPACWVAFFESYLRDLTHVRPIHPETLQFLLRASGFAAVTLEFSSPVDYSSRLQTAGAGPDATPALAALVQVFNDNVEKLNGRMFSYQDYAAIGRR